MEPPIRGIFIQILVLQKAVQIGDIVSRSPRYGGEQALNRDLFRNLVYMRPDAMYICTSAITANEE